MQIRRLRLPAALLLLALALADRLLGLELGIDPTAALALSFGAGALGVRRPGDRP